ncbi:hypothetical protein BDP27DRAFT_1373213 [Rhodocollybia butyracea]|uniref:Uncharacterized protein n=1 Tax=Rhodocollybia butyracea TaxID=206335 RepID=A0A9P5P6W9_9AGAR|nr:hypothetical protein BDP27DRAFT_1373213 [Rhodocollybia butyracea]
MYSLQHMVTDASGGKTPIIEFRTQQLPISHILAQIQTQTNFYELAERCGAQGLHMHNQIIQSQLEMRGISIAESDVLALSLSPSIQPSGLCKPLVDAIGHRMAYDAAVEANLSPDIIALYEIGAIKNDASWFVKFSSGLGQSTVQNGG